MTYDFNRPSRYLLPLFAFMFAGFNHAALAQQPPVVVKTYGQHFGGNIVYQQQVTNNGNRDVVGISIGENADTDRGELKALPVGSSMFKRKINPASISGPTGWTAELFKSKMVGVSLNGARLGTRSQTFKQDKPCTLVSPYQSLTKLI